MDAAQAASVDEYSGQPVTPVSVAMICLGTLAVILRIISRRITGVRLWWDDWLILAALPFMWFEAGVILSGLRWAHFGYHIWTITSPSQLSLFLGFVYGFQIAYCIAVTLPKFSILAMYWRIFGMQNFKWPLIATAVVTLMYLIAVVLVATFSCIPVAGFWDRSIPAKCLTLLNFYIGQAVATMTIDVALLLLPIIPVRRLNITGAQKFAVICIFGLGIFVTVCSAIRLKALIDTTTNPTAAEDPVYYFVPAAVWSVAETGLSVVCACLPSMRPLLRYILHGRFDSSRGVSSGGGRNGHNSAVESSNRNSNFGISGLAAKAGIRNKSAGGASGGNGSNAFERAQQWERANSKRNSRLSSKQDSRRPGMPQRGASYPLTKLGAPVSGSIYEDNREFGHHSRLPPRGRRDNWQELPSSHEESGDLTPWDESISPRSRVRTMYEVEERVKRVLSPVSASRNESGDDVDEKYMHRKSHQPRKPSATDESGPIRLDEYEIHSEPADPGDTRSGAFGYRYEIRAGLEDEDAGSSSQSSTDKVWEVEPKR